METLEILKSIGLNDNESKVYLAVLELGASTVLPISKKSGIKRTYCYDILESLLKKGFVSHFSKNGRRRYLAADPKQIEALLENKLNRFSEALPQLRSIYNSSPEKPTIRFFEGKEIKNIYEMLPSAKYIDSIASPEYIYQYLGNYFDEIVKLIAKKKVAVREIVPEKNKDAGYIKNFQKPDEELRFLPKEVQLSTDIIIFDDKVALISFAKKVHAVLIESSSIVETQRYMFDLIWQMAKSPSSR
ncbi:MAG: helix-turn-helix domain-containing protein [Candidatus Berkelbacteria bacterium]